MRLLLAILLLSAAQFGTQLFLPALPDMAAHFALSDADTRQIIMLYFISFGLSQLFYGPWSDAIGHRKVFLTGQGLYILGSLLCYLSYSATMLAAGRILQGLGAGAPLVISRVILGDNMNGEKLRKAFGSLAVAASIISVLAPFLGGWLTTHLGWQRTFLILTSYLLLVGLIGLMLLPSHQQAAKALSVRHALSGYAGLIVNQQFLNTASFKWLPTMLFLGSITYFPFALQNQFGLSAAQYGSYMMLPACGLIIGSSLARVIQRYCSNTAILAIFWPFILIAGLILQANPASLETILFAFSLFMIATGAYYPSSLQMIMTPFKQQAGAASALLGAIDMLVFSSLATLINRYWVDSIQSLGSVYLCCAVLLAVNWLVLQYGLLNKGMREVTTE